MGVFPQIVHSLGMVFFLKQVKENKERHIPYQYAFFKKYFLILNIFLDIR